MRIVSGRFKGRTLKAPRRCRVAPDLGQGAPGDFQHPGARGIRGRLLARGSARGRPLRGHRRARARSALARREILPVHRGRSGVARDHPRECRSAGTDGCEQDLAARCDEPWRARHARPLRSRVPRSALSQGTDRAHAHGPRIRRLAESERARDRRSRRGRDDARCRWLSRCSTTASTATRASPSCAWRGNEKLICVLSEQHAWRPRSGRAP